MGKPSMNDERLPKINVFSESKAKGEKGEGVVKELLSKDDFKKSLVNWYVKKPFDVDFSPLEPNKKVKLQGVDARIKTKVPESLSIEIKTRDTSYYDKHDVAVETWSKYRQRIKGWAWTSKSDVILYGWFGSAIMTWLVDLCFIRTAMLKEALEEKCAIWKDLYKERRARNDLYDTFFIPVPVVVLERLGICSMSLDVCGSSYSNLLRNGSKEVIYEVNENGNHETL